MTNELVLSEVDDGILTISLNQPDKLNVINSEMWRLLGAAFESADANDDVRAVVITGKGKAFCAGLDISAGSSAFGRGMQQGEGAGSAPATIRRGPGGILALRIFDCKKPVIGAINGTAVGVGITMCLPMDIRICSSAAKIGFVFTRRGIIPEACSTWFLPRLVGISRALDWTYSGRVFSADEGKAAGLFQEVLPPEEVLPRAQAIGREIAANTSAVSIALTRQLMWRLLGADHPMEAHKLEARALSALSGGPDAREGVASFLEKRPPRFTLKASSDMPPFYPWWHDRPFE